MACFVVLPARVQHAHAFASSSTYPASLQAACRCCRQRIHLAACLAVCPIELNTTTDPPTPSHPTPHPASTMEAPPQPPLQQQLPSPPSPELLARVDDDLKEYLLYRGWVREHANAQASTRGVALVAGVCM